MPRSPVTKEKRAEYRKRWHERHPDYNLESSRRRRANLPLLTYVLYDLDGTVIYVGRGNADRIRRHRTKSWWPEVAKIRSRKRSSFADSLVLEALLIRKYQPRYNVQGVTR